MRLGRVSGKLWASVKDPQLEGRRMVLVQPVNEAREDDGDPLVCLDAVGAGTGSLIYWARGKEGALAFHPEVVSSDATIVGIVDELSIGGGEGR